MCRARNAPSRTDAAFRAAARLWLAWLLAIAFAPAADAAGRYDPSLSFRRLATPHFLILFHQDEQALARRLAAVAEHEHRDLVERLRHAPRGRTVVVLVDQTDWSNGLATPVPFNLIEITAVPPPGSSFIGNTDDWLRTVFRHEYAHILHLDRARGWARVARGVFGRSPLAFPNLTLPLWQIEGLATWVEDAGAHGRARAGDFAAVVDVAARAGEGLPLHRANGGLVGWPGGQAPYAYGVFFHAYLARRFGDERLAALADRTSGRLPFLTAGAFRAVFGESLGELWRDFLDERARLAPAEGAVIGRLTSLGFAVDAPRLEASGAIRFTAGDPHGFPRLLRREPDGRLVAIEERYGGVASATAGPAVIFDQLDFHRATALTSDLYARTPDGDTKRLTDGARLLEPDVSHDGRWLAAVQVRPGRRALVVLPLAPLLANPSPLTPRDLRPVADLDEPGVVYATPRWSPDGAVLVAERRRLGGPSEIVTITVPAGAVRVLTTSAAARNVTPAWTPDAARVVFASDRAGGAFQLYDVAADGSSGIRALPAVNGGATAPAVGPDGSVVFVGLTPEGHDLFRMPLEPGDATTNPDSSEPIAGREAARSTPPMDEGPYRPLSLMAPRAWTPVVTSDGSEWRAGGLVTGADALSRHAYSVIATWALSRGADFDGLASRARPDVRAVYYYDRWRPTLFAAFGDETEVFRAIGAGEVVPVVQRDRQVDVGIQWPWRRVRWSQYALAAWHAGTVRTIRAQGGRERTRQGLRAAWSLGTARRYGYSISPEGGIVAGATAELFRPAFGADARADALSADVRAYLPVRPRHAVLAFRAATAASFGEAGARRTLRLGGTTANPTPASFSDDAVSLVRGFSSDVRTGSRVAVLNAELRVPLGWPERGLGTWPAFLRSLHVTAFADAGHAWTDRADWNERLLGAGAELGAGLTLGYGLPLTWTVGAAWGHDGSGRLPSRREVYARVGAAF